MMGYNVTREPRAVDPLHHVFFSRQVSEFIVVVEIDF